MAKFWQNILHKTTFVLSNESENYLLLTLIWVLMAKGISVPFRKKTFAKPSHNKASFSYKMPVGVELSCNMCNKLKYLVNVQKESEMPSTSFGVKAAKA